MKVVLFCGGQGTRLREYSETIPKPMVKIGYRPILWNVMRYYAHFGIKDFILALGYKGDVIKNYFVNYDETISNDFVYTRGGKDIELLTSDIEDWRITFVDTGMHANIGTRLLKVKEHLEGEEMFMANYADGLTDLDLNIMIDGFRSRPEMVGSFMMYRPTASFHVVQAESDGLVKSISPISKAKVWYNTGYFLLRPEIFDYMNCGDELVEKPFQKLIREQRLWAYHHRGFWQSMDTFKDKMLLDDLESKGETYWEVWKHKSPVINQLV
ncbi:MAG: glucose-1-phosphate cytidylyltransferase [Saprospiraceae bacterium]|nr:glucose-1-phosphate cytidylyltransferase [Saprospiraceae bacterium]